MRAVCDLSAALALMQRLAWFATCTRGHMHSVSCCALVDRRAGLQDLKRLISYQSKLRQFLHDAKATPADISPHELDIYVDWTASTPNTPAWLLEEPLPDASKVATRQPYALRSVFEMLQQSGVNTMPTLDFVYCRRTGSSDL